MERRDPEQRRRIFYRRGSQADYARPATIDNAKDCGKSGSRHDPVPAPRSEPRFATRRSGAQGTRSLALKEQSTPARRSLLEQRKERFHVRFARKGGVARAKKLTAEQRRASASKPAKARWGKNHPDFAAPEQTPLKNAATPDLFDLQSISGIPSPDSLPGISEAIDKELMARFYNTLSDHHQQQFANNGLAPPDQQTSRDMNQLWDEFIITQARVIGHRIFLSRCCLQTILQWWSEAKNGPEFLLRLGKSLSMGARLLRGEAKAPVEAAHYGFRTD